MDGQSEGKGLGLEGCLSWIIKPSGRDGSQRMIMKYKMNWLLCIWLRTEMICTCREGAPACCNAADMLNEREMRISTLLIPPVMTGARTARHKCNSFLQRAEIISQPQNLPLPSRLEIQRWWVGWACWGWGGFKVLIWLVLGILAQPLQHRVLKNSNFRAKSNPEHDRYSNKAKKKS